MGYHHEGLFQDPVALIICLIGVAAQILVGSRLRLPQWLSRSFAALTGLLYLSLAEHVISPRWPLLNHTGREVGGQVTFTVLLACIGTAVCLLLRDRVPAFKSERRHFLRTSTAALCAVPAAVLGVGIITRKDFRVREIDLRFPQLASDLHNLRILQISDIHMGTFFSRGDLRRVVDACNGLRPDLAVITGDLITDVFDPLLECLQELKRLRASSGLWGCMGNHELYSNLEAFTQAKARELDIFFLRQQAQILRFGTSRLNLVGIDYQSSAPYLRGIESLLSPGDFNLLLSHTPEVFNQAVQKGIDLTLSGHTHGGQLNLDVLGTNFNVVDLKTPYTKGLYVQGNSKIYVNSGLGTIGLPARVGAPPEITVIRLCNT